MNHAAYASGIDATAGRFNRSAAFAAARRHSRRVWWLKRAIVAGSAAGVAVLVALSAFDPFARLPVSLSIAAASLSGTKITMELPKLDGFRKDGKPYQVRARSGVQDVRNAKVIELNEIEARIHMENENSVSIIAPRGIFNSEADQMRLESGRGGEAITLKSTSGFDVLLRSADVNLKAGTLVSKEAVSVRMPNGSIDAERVEVTDGGRAIVFEGNVRSQFNPPDGGGDGKAN